VHIAHPDGKRVIPFDTYNLFYRDDLEQRRARAAARRRARAGTSSRNQPRCPAGMN